MKLKYYLRGLGIGIIVTTIILMISFSGRNGKMTDDEVIARARQLGMVMPEENMPDDMDNGEPDSEGLSDGDPDGADAGGNSAGTAADAGGDKADVTDVSAGQPQSKDAPGEPLAGGTAGEANHVAVGGEDAQPEDNSGAADGYHLTVNRGDVCRVICEDLAANGVVSDAEALREYLLQIGYASHISVGEYVIPYGLTNEEIAEVLKAGPLEKDDETE